MQPEGRVPPPPSNPRGWIVAGMLIIVIAFGGFGTWAALASLDSAAIATGVVVVESDSKSIQHLEGGLVKEILVRDGDKVEKGDVLIRLEDTHAGATYDIDLLARTVTDVKDSNPVAVVVARRRIIPADR